MPNDGGGSSSWLFERNDAVIRAMISPGSDEFNPEDTEIEEGLHMRYEADDDGRHMRMVFRTRQVDGEWQEYSSSDSESSSESNEESESEGDENLEDSDDYDDAEVDNTSLGSVESTDEDGRPSVYVSTPYDCSALTEVVVDQQMVDSGLVCSICLIAPELGNTVTNLNCGHIFHTACITEWLSQTPTCPLCRRIAVPLRDRNHPGGFNRNNTPGNNSDWRQQQHERHVHWAFLTRLSRT